MLHRHCFKAVDKNFRDILLLSNPRSADISFGGKVVVLGGDFRKIISIIPKGTRHDFVHASINSSRLWNHCQVLKLTKNMRLQTGSSCFDVNELKEFSDWILNVGYGYIGENNDGEAEIVIPDDMLIKNSGDRIASIVNSTYPSL
jgi:ATP-dependent DNA helicase PIF1